MLLALNITQISHINIDKNLPPLHYYIFKTGLRPNSPTSVGTNSAVNLSVFVTLTGMLCPDGEVMVKSQDPKSAADIWGSTITTAA